MQKIELPRDMDEVTVNWAVTGPGERDRAMHWYTARTTGLEPAHDTTLEAEGLCIDDGGGVTILVRMKLTDDGIELTVHRP